MSEELKEILDKLLKKQLNLLHARIELERIPDYSNIQTGTVTASWSYSEIDNGSFSAITEQIDLINAEPDDVYFTEINKDKIKIKIETRPDLYIESKIEKANARRKELQEQITQLENEVEMLVTDAYINYGIHSE